MGRAMRIRIFVAAGLASSLALGGCSNFDPMDKIQDLDIMQTSKPKLLGERKPVFSTGVPGVPQGVPPDLVKGYQPPAEPPPAPVAEVKPKPRKVVVRRPPPPRAVQQEVEPQPTRSAPAARTTTTTAEQGGMQPMTGSAPAWPTNAPPAPAAWPGPQR